MKLVIELSIVILVLIGFIIFLIYKVANNNIKIYDIKFSEALKILNTNLKEKYDISLKVIEFLNCKVKLNEDPLHEFLNTNLKSIELNELNNILLDTDEYIEKYLEKNEKLINTQDYKDITKGLNNINMTINATIKYYNKNATEYNQLIKKIPYNIISKIKKIESKNKFKEQKKSELKILK